MKRLFVPIAAIELSDGMHTVHPDGTFSVDQAKDGQTAEQHEAGIEYIRGLLERGQKVLPALLRDNGDGTYQQLDGFKRILAHHRAGHKLVEAFVVTQEEYDGAVFFEYAGRQMRAWHGGQDGEGGKFPLQEGGERPDFKYEDTVFLYKGDGPDQLRIEVSECIHVHWSDSGRFRLAMGGRDFMALAEMLVKASNG